jgi:hypothetical protein
MKIILKIILFPSICALSTFRENGMMRTVMTAIAHQPVKIQCVRSSSTVEMK